jgi:hypothetical protein
MEKHLSHQPAAPPARSCKGTRKRRRGDRMAHVRMPRFHATAWVSKPTTPVAPDPTRGGYSNSRAGPWHQDTPPRRPRRGLVTPVRQAKGVRTGSVQDRSPVARHQSRPPPPSVTARPREKGPETTRPNRKPRSGTHPDTLVPVTQKKSKNHLFHSDTTDPID